MSDQSQVPPAEPGNAPSTTGPRAGFWTRFGGALADGILMSAVGFAIGKLFGQEVVTVKDGTFSFKLTGAAFLLSIAIQVAYYVYFEGGATGQTLGKKLAGIRVIGIESGEPIGYGPATARYFGRLVSAVPCLLGYFWMLWDNNKQTWHDKFAKSIVVRTTA